MECQNCGNTIDEMDEFCTECGTNIIPRETDEEFLELKEKEKEEEES